MRIKHTMVRGKRGSGYYRCDDKVQNEAWGHIHGVFMVTPDLVSGQKSPKPRLCFMVVFRDGVIDYWPVSGAKSMEFGS